MRNDKNKQRNGSNRRNNSRNFSSGESGLFGNNNRFQNNNFSRGHKEMHTVTCSECKKECEVPFKPTEGKPVYCKECFQKHKPKRF